MKEYMQYYFTLAYTTTEHVSLLLVIDKHKNCGWQLRQQGTQNGPGIKISLEWKRIR
jgi:hypothetical protein